jgi:uncharacterized membrane protein YgdD (TMEM256/DUF423 family)
MYKPALLAGCIFAALAVILGAFGAHALKEILTPDQLMTFETGVRYQFYHSFALVACGMLFSNYPFRQIKTAFWLFLVGILFFSGSLYAITLMKANGAGSLGPIGIITPIGGLLFILGWLMLTVAVAKKQ